MKTQLIAALLVAVSAAVAAPAFANESGVTRAQVRAELVQLEVAGYAPGRANDPHYPNDLQAALARIHVHANDAVTADTVTSGYGSDTAAVTQSGSRAPTRVAERSIYFGH
ncbi:DUF4148 domain-containing protein [Burkholderia sp. IDO3]|uniref:DUF4148 domain-containing protein n=1 Tax=Burkholderia sp. IDO3 TaxID=1705310 RepID=UPI000BBA49F0|nr:DUF4148 domain-containing protein [Burkholderia sp. IDO3]AXK67115.1 DUF4148 domain-containing protein [Burkholderia sp. IDO3]PCD60494.1 hypothetical protein CN645_18265 [Burkholderia sp. IDO3]